MIFNPKNITSTFVVYQHEFMNLATKTFHLAYIGCCRLDQITNAPDARRNKEWMKLLRSPEYGNIRVEIISSHSSLEAAFIAAGNCSVIMNAPIKSGTERTLETPNYSIMCVDDGRKFLTISAAADAYGVHRTAIQNHLAGRYGYTKVKGYRFVRINEPVKSALDMLEDV